MRAVRGAIAVLAGVAALAAVAYAAAPHGSRSGPAPERERGGARVPLPTPRIASRPDKVSASPTARFSFSARGRNLRFQCRLDSRAWSPCHPPVLFARLAVGSHRFSVRTAGRRGTHSRAAAYRWRVLEPKDFSISPQLSSLAPLYPGAAAQPLPLKISNPNPVPILVTSLEVRASGDANGCASGENLLLGAAGLSPAAPLAVPANGSATLPAPGVAAPTIALRDLPVNQDACQGATFPLEFSGRARG